MLYVPAGATPGLNVANPQSVVVIQPGQAGEMLQVETPVMVPGGMVTVVQAASVTQVPVLMTAPLAASVMVYGILAPVVLVSQNWMPLVAEGDMVEN